MNKTIVAYGVPIKLEKREGKDRCRGVQIAATRYRFAEVSRLSLALKAALDLRAYRMFKINHANWSNFRMSATMIENPTQKQLVELISKESGTCVSLLMGTFEKGHETAQNSIRFKNLIGEAIEKVGDGCRKLKDRLQELSKLANDDHFWQNQSAGFALYVAADFEKQLMLDQAPDDVVCVAEHFYVTPIANLCSGGGSTRVLALSWEHARLFSCNGREVNEICNQQFPVAMNELVTERDPEEQLQFSTHSTQGGGPSGPGGGSTAMYHGHGEGEDKIAADRDMYLNRVGRMTADAIYNTNHPLVVVATDEVAGHFCSITDIDVMDVVHASPDGLEEQDLRKRIIEASRPLLKKSGESMIEKLGTAIASEKGSRDLAEIVVQSADGRIDTLLLGDIGPQYGSFDRSSRKVLIDENGEADLLNLAVRETIQAGGSVIQLADVDADVSVAAIYRF